VVKPWAKETPANKQSVHQHFISPSPAGPADTSGPSQTPIGSSPGSTAAGAKPIPPSNARTSRGPVEGSTPGSTAAGRSAAPPSSHGEHAGGWVGSAWHGIVWQVRCGIIRHGCRRAHTRQLLGCELCLDCYCCCCHVCAMRKQRVLGLTEPCSQLP
jgi:hypothetical protein